jgi:hypothetical protein
MNGGQLSNDHFFMYIGDENPGVFTQSGGSITSGRTFYVGSSAQGNYLMQGGTLKVAEIMVSKGSFDHSAGKVLDSFVRVQPEGLYRLSDDGEIVGYSGFAIDGGSLMQTGGEIHLLAGGLRGDISFVGSQRSHYRISGGEVDADNLSLNNTEMTITGGSAVINLNAFWSAADSRINLEINETGLAEMQVAETAALDGVLAVTDCGAGFGRFAVLTAQGGLTGDFDHVILPEGPWSWGIDNQQTFWIEHVPEPGCAALVCCGGVFIVRRRNHRKN